MVHWKEKPQELGEIIVDKKVMIDDRYLETR